jgi:hypothetical protein
MNITLLREAKTKSGHPGRFFLCSLYRKPSFHANLRTNISGLVFLLLIAAIKELLCARVR